MVSASHCVGFTLPGMIDDPGSLAGRISSPNPERGPDARKRMSLAILLSETATTLSAPEASTIASCAASASNLFPAVTKGRLGNFRSEGFGEAGMRIQAGADGGAALREVEQPRHRPLNAGDAVFHLR